jgi:hypothetical protein
MYAVEVSDTTMMTKAVKAHQQKIKNKLLNEIENPEEIPIAIGAEWFSFISSVS